MQAVQTDLTILGAHTTAPAIFWKGQVVPGITAIRVDNSAAVQRVTITLPEDPVLAEMAAAGIIIKREVAA